MYCGSTILHRVAEFKEDDIKMRHFSYAYPIDYANWLVNLPWILPWSHASSFFASITTLEIDLKGRIKNPVIRATRWPTKDPLVGKWRNWPLAASRSARKQIQEDETLKFHFPTLCGIIYFFHQICFKWRRSNQENWPRRLELLLPLSHPGWMLLRFSNFSQTNLSVLVRE